MNSIPKQWIILIILSIASMFMQHELARVLVFMLHLHTMLGALLFHITSHLGDVGKVMQGIIALILIPAMAGGVVAGVFWLFKHVSMPHMMSVIWVVWLVMLVSILAQGTRV